MHLVQCKQRRATKVGVEVVRELFGVMAARGATAAYVVTPGSFTEPAHEFAKERNVRLIDGPRLSRLREAVQDAPHSAKAHASTEKLTAPPACPLCSRPIVPRTASRGPNRGHEFWGCKGYPTCKGTLPV